jgi:uncharacterized protein (DUF1501 family)
MKTLYLEGALYTAISALTPVVAFLQTDKPLTPRMLVVVVLIGVISGCTALKAFLSTSYSRATGDAILVRDEPVAPATPHPFQ